MEKPSPASSTSSETSSSESKSAVRRRRRRVPKEPILSFFPGEPRPQQAEVLLTLEKAWNDFDVFVVNAPVAVGKSRIAVTLQRWLKHCQILTPSNLLQAQYTAEFPELPTLWRQNLYDCDTYQQDCHEVKRVRKYFCKGCIYSKSKRESEAAKGGVYNYYTYLVHKLYRSALIIDEAHQILGAIQDLNSKRLWWKDWRWPPGLKTLADVLVWIEGMKDWEKNETIAALRADIMAMESTTVLHLTTDMWHGRPEKVLKLLPINTEAAAPVFWPLDSVEKIVLMSATISPHDVRQMGLSGRRVAYLECDSPIPAVRRPVTYAPVGDMSMASQEENVPKLVEWLEKQAAAHPNEKGLVHAPYSLAGKIAELWKNPRLLTHNKATKLDAYAKFRAADHKEGAILLASGMYEGVDLPYEAGRWQAICKVPWPNLGDPGIRAKKEQDPQWYAWQAIRDTLQASGRICRTPDDHGETFLLDSSFKMLYGTHRALFPNWFRVALGGM